MASLRHTARRAHSIGDFLGGDLVPTSRVGKAEHTFARRFRVDDPHLAGKGLPIRLFHSRLRGEAPPHDASFGGHVRHLEELEAEVVPELPKSVVLEDVARLVSLWHRCGREVVSYLFTGRSRVCAATAGHVRDTRPMILQC